MSPEYNNVVAQLKAHFLKLMTGEPWTIRISRADYALGTDSLGEPFGSMVRATFQKWLREHNYEVSYMQLCRAFFGAAEELGKLDIY